MRSRQLLFVILAVAPLLGCDEAVPDFAPAEASEPATVTSSKNVPTKGPIWPRWSGPNADFISRETGWNSDWKNSPPKIAWQAELGIGFASFSVDGDRVYSMGNVEGKDFVYCLDAKTGKVIWDHSYECSLVANLHEGGPSATPTIDGGRLFTLSKEGHLFCLDATTGDVIWSGHLKAATGVTYPEWGFCCSPRIMGDNVILEGGRVVALNKKSGKLVWKSKTEYLPGYGSPAFFQHGGKDMIAVLNNDGVLVVQASDGAEVAFHEWQTSFATNSTTPIVVDDTIYISTGYNRGCTLLKFDGSSLEPIYENREMRNHYNNSVLWKGHLYGIDGNSHNERVCTVVCTNFKSGEKKWEHREFGCGSVMIADEKLLILSSFGELVLAELTPEEFKETARMKVLEGRCWTVPVIAGGRIYCRNAAGNMVCVDVRMN